MVAVDADRLVHVARREVRGKGVGQALLPGQLGAEEAGAEQPDRHMGVRARHRDHLLPRLTGAKERFQLLDVPRKVVGAAQAVTAQRASGELVGAGSATKAQFDAARIERGEGAELLGDHQRRVVRQHDAARAQPQCRGIGSEITEQHGGGRAGDTVHVVVLGHPEAGKAQALDVPGKFQGVVQSLGGAAVVTDGRQIESGQGQLGEGSHGARPE
ncbi:hypothetical protein D3C80_481010 [compost metagenome]